jgi:predicted nucleotidyltransferase
MPVRSLTSPVLKWPDARTVIRALRHWTKKVAQDRPEVVHIGFFGSYARGDWGVGSDLDLLIIVAGSDRPFEQRPGQFDTQALPVPVDILVYTQEEWQVLKSGRKFFQRLDRETTWVYPRPEKPK